MLKKYEEFNENIDWEFDEDESYEIHQEFVGHEDFYNFLVKNNILEKYISNYYKYRFKIFKELNIKEFLDTVKKSRYINSFNWHITGDDYYLWAKFNKKWLGFF